MINLPTQVRNLLRHIIGDNSLLLVLGIRVKITVSLNTFWDRRIFLRVNFNSMIYKDSFNLEGNKHHIYFVKNCTNLIIDYFPLNRKKSDAEIK